MKRTIAILMVILTVFLSACGSQTKTPSPSAKPADTAKKDTVEIIFAGFSGPEMDAHKRLAPNFEKFTNGRIKVRIEEMARDAYDTKMMTTLQAKTGTFDTFLVNLDRLALWYPGGFLSPVNDLLDNPEKYNQPNYDAKDYPQAMLDLFKIDGKNYAVPQEASAILMFYRKDLFQKYGVTPPTEKGFTWEEYLAAAKKIQDGLRKDGINDVYGTVHSGKRTRHLGIESTQAIWSFGAEYIDSKANVTLDQPTQIKALETYLSQDTADKVTPPGVGGYEYPEVLTFFQQGKAAMAIEWNAAAIEFYDAKKSPAIAGNVGVTAFPYEKTVGPDAKRIWPSIHALAVCAQSKHQQEALEYMAWFTSKEVAKDYVTNGGGSSGRTSLLTDKTILEKSPWYNTLSQSMALYHSLPMLPELNYINEQIFAVALNGIITSQTQDVATVLKNAKKEMDDYLVQKGRIKK